MNVATASAFRLSSVRGLRPSTLVAAALLALAAASAQAGDIYYRCPDNVFTNTITPKEAESRGCKEIGRAHV